MTKYFYSHLIEIESLILELDNLNLSKDQKLHLAQLIDANLHHTILDTILSQLSDEEKRVFLKLLSEGSHDKIWQHLNTKIDKIEEKIKQAAQNLKRQLHEDINQTRGKLV